MTLAEPPPDVLEGADWEAIRELADHAQELARKGPITEHVYRALWAASLKASGDHPELLETLRMFAPEGVEDLFV